jgi:arylsulfatase A-like enzyme
VRTVVDAAKPNTLILFLGDNGNASNRPLRGRKTQLYEGGIRVPFLLRWTGRVPGGRTVSDPVSAVDIVPTVLAAAAAGAPLPPDLDGVSLLAPVPAERAIFFADVHGAGHAVRKGRWKLLDGYGGQTAQLYDVVADRGELVNLAARNPIKVGELRATIAAWRSQL